MPLIPVLTTWLIGWLVLHLLGSARLNPAGIATAWLLGTGAMYGVYYLSFLLFHANPAPVIFYAGAAAGALMLWQDRRSWDHEAWRPLRSEWRWSLLFIPLLAGALFLAWLNGFANDGTVIWLGRARAYAMIPDYLFHLRAPYPSHANYPPLLIHQLEWQSAFTGTTLGIKLPQLIYRATIWLLVFALLSERVQHPVRWTFFTATLVLYWHAGTINQADVPLSVYVLAGIFWLRQAMDTRHIRDTALGVILIALGVGVKQEGLVLAGCTFLVLLWMAYRLPDLRRWLLRTAVTLGIGAGIVAGMWYVLVVIGGVESGDFIMNRLNLAGFLAALPTLPVTLLKLNRFQGVWFVFVGVLLVRARRLMITRDSVFWLLPLLYAVIMILPYMVSDRIDIAGHMENSYHRLLLHVTPLIMVFLAQSLDSAFAPAVESPAPHEQTA